ncbi:hypothetical protein Taro_028300 [Colocasia esculenta]|uniref:Uncharacterized protein n=1 Tax=Colocasia esculenta TaxID=4460 RepID=A0A843VRF2_COLES|nr:hypothetical protein [Colocasia esculenta]
MVNHTYENKKRKEVHAISRELQRYNQLVVHVGIHGQRRFTEALVKRSLVYRFGMTGKNPEIATGVYKDGNRDVRTGVRSRQVYMRKATRRCQARVATGHSKGRNGSGLEGDRVT